MVKAVESAIPEQRIPSVDLRVTTPGARFQVRWDENGSASALGPLAFLAEFLDVSGLFDRWVDRCPRPYTSPNAPAVCDVLGTWRLSILAGQRRYAHVSGRRGDAVAPQILGLARIISDESLRRALQQLVPGPNNSRSEDERIQREAQLAKSTAWMDAALKDRVYEALSTGGILDGDTTVKPLYGPQDGAERGYTPPAGTPPSSHSHLLDRRRAPGTGC